MNEILKYYTMKQIAEKCGVSCRTVYNWKKLGTMPIKFLKVLGFEVKLIKDSEEP